MAPTLPFLASPSAILFTSSWTISAVLPSMGPLLIYSPSSPGLILILLCSDTFASSQVSPGPSKTPSPWALPCLPLPAVWSQTQHMAAL